MCFFVSPIGWLDNYYPAKGKALQICYLGNPLFGTKTANIVNVKLLPLYNIKTYMYLAICTRHCKKNKIQTVSLHPTNPSSSPALQDRDVFTMFGYPR